MSFELPTIAELSGTLELFIIQPTRFCNINCSYCYLPDRTDKNLMSGETLEWAFRRVFSSPFPGRSFTVVWHAGEPLMAPRAFYEAAIALATNLKPPGVTVRHNIQTNGTLITDEWARFFAKNDIRIGISLDGPDFVHDAMRRTRAGAGTHAAVMRGIAHLRKHNVPFHIIAVIHRDSLQHADEIWKFFQSEGIDDIGFNIEESEGANTGSTLDQNGDEPVAQFVSKLFGKYARNGKSKVREFDGIVNSILADDILPLAPSQQSFGQTSSPMKILSIDVEGNFSTFSPELLGHKVHGERFVFGNVHKDTFESMLDSPRFQSAFREIADGVGQCRETCSYFALCRGGCPSNKYFEKGTFAVAETAWCRRSKQIFIDVVIDGLEVHLRSSDATSGRAAIEENNTETIESSSDAAFVRSAS